MDAANEKKAHKDHILGNNFLIANKKLRELFPTSFFPKKTVVILGR